MRRILTCSLMTLVAACGGGGGGGGPVPPAGESGDASKVPAGLPPEVTLGALIERVAPGFTAQQVPEETLKALAKEAYALRIVEKGWELDNPGVKYTRDFEIGETPAPAPSLSCGAVPVNVRRQALVSSDLASTFGGGLEEAAAEPAAFATYHVKREYVSALYDTKWTDHRYVGVSGRKILVVTERSGAGEIGLVDYERCATLIDVDASREQKACATRSQEAHSWTVDDLAETRALENGLYRSDIKWTLKGHNFQTDVAVAVRETLLGAFEHERAEDSKSPDSHERFKGSVAYGNEDKCTIVDATHEER